MTALEESAGLVVLLAVGGFSGWAIYCAQRARRRIPPRLESLPSRLRAMADVGKAMVDIRQTDEELFAQEQQAQIWETISDLGENWNWPTTLPSQEIYDQCNPRPWARRDR